MKQGQKFVRQDETGDSIKMKGKVDTDAAMRDALLDPESGLMRAGALPKISSLSAAGSKALLDTIEKARKHRTLLRLLFDSYVKTIGVK